MTLDRADAASGTIPRGRRQLHAAVLGSQAVELPIVPLGDGLGAARFAPADVSLSFVRQAAIELAERLVAIEPDVVVTAECGGLLVGTTVATALGHDQCVVLHRSPSSCPGGSLIEPVGSGSSGGAHRLRLDALRFWLVEDRNVVYVDDVIASGIRAAAALRLLRRAGAKVVAVGALASQGDGWRATLGPDAALVRVLGSLPVFTHAVERGWVAADQRSDSEAGLRVQSQVEHGSGLPGFAR